MEIRKVGVVGCGLMGSGIAQSCAQAGYDVAVAEATPDLAEKGVRRVGDALQKLVDKGKLPAADRETILARLRPASRLEDLRDRDLVIEAVIENLEEKKRVFRTLDTACPPGTILASNTSSVSLTALAFATKRPDRVLGLHFFNPVPVMRLVEMVVPETTSADTVRAAKAFGESLGKVVVTAKDTPGFIVNLLLVPYLLDAVRAVENGVCTKEDMDQAMKLGCAHPMGPIELLDFVGLDTTLYIAEVLFDAFREPRYAPPPLLRRMVAAGFLGRKSGRGFYRYS